ncbi:MAG: hypothetical protein NVSMB19_16380 [Vulcanimicrobiaceae bacterium]
MAIDRPNAYLSTGNTAAKTTAYQPWRDVLGYDPFRRFFSSLDPEIDVVRNENGFDVEIPVAGYKPEQIDVSVKDDVLTVAGKSDRRAFTRALKLPDDVDTANIDARVEHGMLSLRLQRHPEAQPRKIAVATGSV